MENETGRWRRLQRLHLRLLNTFARVFGLSAGVAAIGFTAWAVYYFFHPDAARRRPRHAKWPCQRRLSRCGDLLLSPGDPLSLRPAISTGYHPRRRRGPQAPTYLVDRRTALMESSPAAGRLTTDWSGRRGWFAAEANVRAAAAQPDRSAHSWGRESGRPCTRNPYGHRGVANTNPVDHAWFDPTGQTKIPKISAW